METENLKLTLTNFIGFTNFHGNKVLMFEAGLTSVLHYKDKLLGTIRSVVFSTRKRQLN